METLHNPAEPAIVVATGTGQEIARRGIRFDDGRAHLIGSECIACAARAWPPASRCHACWNDVRTIELSTTGKLYAFTRVHVGPPTLPRPYAIGYVDLPEGVRVFTHLREDRAPLAIDASVELHAETGDGERFWFEVKQ
jgi:uncharacterized OB-fold protein